MQIQGEICHEIARFTALADSDAADRNSCSYGRRWTFTFAPSGDKEFEGLGDAGVCYRKTIKVRLLAETRLPKPVAFRTFTESLRQPLGVRVPWGKPASNAIKIGDADSCRLEVFNGRATSVRALSGSNFTVNDKQQWTLPKTVEGGMQIDLDPNSKPMQSVTINGKKHDRFDVKKEWIEIQADAKDVQNVVVEY